MAFGGKIVDNASKSLPFWALRWAYKSEAKNVQATSFSHSETYGKRTVLMAPTNKSVDVEKIGVRFIVLSKVAIIIPFHSISSS